MVVGCRRWSRRIERPVVVYASILGITTYIVSDCSILRGVCLLHELERKFVTVIILSVVYAIWGRLFLFFDEWRL